jgi:hypothetical protein
MISQNFKHVIANWQMSPHAIFAAPTFKPLQHLAPIHPDIIPPSQTQTKYKTQDQINTI